jgi:hypothetical protein
MIDRYTIGSAKLFTAICDRCEAELSERPKPSDNPDLAPYFAWKGQIGCVRSEEFSEATFGPELAERVRDFLVKLMPLYDYFNKFKV